jgi:hypothetical protein
MIKMKSGPLGPAFSIVGRGEYSGTRPQPVLPIPSFSVVPWAQEP